MSTDQQYDNELQGSLFKNDKKTTDKHPDYKGSAQIEGVEYWLSAWVNTSRDGRKYMKLKFEPKQTEQAAAAPIVTDDTDDDLPF